ncbi:TonB-dependent receptor [Dongia sp.]|uniref:TonB-dependent receptor n=1 Tax=Dongia sp. TaxID=1977262 RepID=UPI0035B245D1
MTNDHLRGRGDRHWRWEPHRQTSMRRASLAAAFILTLLCLLPSTSVAQETEPPLEPDEAEAEDALVLQPITVTARRRDERAQDAPVALTVTPPEEIGKGKVDNFEDMALRSPNTLYSSQGGPLSIRGVGSLGIDGGVDRQPAVGMFLDEVFIARPFGYPTYLEDTERVEVVRGSQATLYGKNTIGGAVNMISRDPGKDFGIEAEGTLGSGPGFDEPLGRVKAAFDAPLGESDFAVRGYASWSAAGGYIANLADDGDSVGDTDALATRFVAKGTIDDDTDLRLSLDYSRNRDDGGLWYAPVDLAFDYEAEHDYEPSNKLDIAGISMRLDHDFGLAELTSITALRGHEMEEYLDGDFTAVSFLGQAQTESQRQVSQDLRLASTGDGPFKWRGGIFYMHEWFEGDQYFDLASVPKDDWSRTTFDQETDTYSAFTELSYAIVPELELIGGLRYTYERKVTESEISSPSGTMMFGTPGAAAGTASFGNWSPEATLVYHIDDDNLAFAKYSRGFKSGGISPFIDTGNKANRYDPETTDSYELGIKTNWLNERLSVNASLFYIDWKDQQAVIYTTPFTRIISNAAAATSMGGELEIAARLTENLGLTAGYGYTDAEYDEFVDEILGADYSGNPLPYAPRHSASVGLRWESDLNEDLLFTSGIDYTYRSSYSFHPNNEFRQEPTSLVDARIGIEGEAWAATLWAKNLLDEEYLRQYFSYSGTDMGVAAAGRTFGLTVKASW